MLNFNISFRPTLLVILLCTFVETSCYSQQTKHMSMNVIDDILVPKTYHINSTDEVFTIDGLANETSWSTAEWTDNFIDIEGIKIPKHDTRLKMLWDDTYLYIYAILAETHIAANLIQHDTVIFYDKNFEVFIDHNDDTYQYVELEINALNTTWDLYLDRPYRSGGVALDEYEMQGIKHAIHIDGTLNDASDEDRSWSVELAIPFEAILKRFNKGIVPGGYWRMNFSRVNWDQKFEDGMYKRLRDAEGKLNKEYNWVWSNQGAINMHQPEMWGYVFFAKDKNESFDLPDSYLDRQIAFACFRNMRKKPWRELKNTAPGFVQEFDINSGPNQSFSGSFHKTNAGFELLIENTATQQTFVIDQSGRFKTN